MLHGLCETSPVGSARCSSLLAAEAHGHHAEGLSSTGLPSITSTCRLDSCHEAAEVSSASLSASLSGASDFCLHPNDSTSTVTTTATTASAAAVSMANTEGQLQERVALTQAPVTLHKISHHALRSPPRFAAQLERKTNDHGEGDGGSALLSPPPLSQTLAAAATATQGCTTSRAAIAATSFPSVSSTSGSMQPGVAWASPPAVPIAKAVSGQGRARTRSISVSNHTPTPAAAAAAPRDADADVEGNTSQSAALPSGTGGEVALLFADTLQQHVVTSHSQQPQPPSLTPISAVRYEEAEESAHHGHKQHPLSMLSTLSTLDSAETAPMLHPVGAIASAPSSFYHHGVHSHHRISPHWRRSHDEPVPTSPLALQPTLGVTEGRQQQQPGGSQGRYGALRGLPTEGRRAYFSTKACDDGRRGQLSPASVPRISLSSTVPSERLFTLDPPACAASSAAAAPRLRAHSLSTPSVTAHATLPSPTAVMAERALSVQGTRISDEGEAVLSSRSVDCIAKTRDPTDVAISAPVDFEGLRTYPPYPLRVGPSSILCNTRRGKAGDCDEAALTVVSAATAAVAGPSAEEGCARRVCCVEEAALESTARKGCHGRGDSKAACECTALTRGCSSNSSLLASPATGGDDTAPEGGPTGPIVLGITHPADISKGGKKGQGYDSLISVPSDREASSSSEGDASSSDVARSAELGMDSLFYRVMEAECREQRQREEQASAWGLLGKNAGAAAFTAGVGPPNTAPPSLLVKAHFSALPRAPAFNLFNAGAQRSPASTGPSPSFSAASTPRLRSNANMTSTPSFSPSAAVWGNRSPRPHAPAARDALFSSPPSTPQLHYQRTIQAPFVKGRIDVPLLLCPSEREGQTSPCEVAPRRPMPPLSPGHHVGKRSSIGESSFYEFTEPARTVGAKPTPPLPPAIELSSCICRSLSESSVSSQSSGSSSKSTSQSDMFCQLRTRSYTQEEQHQDSATGAQWVSTLIQVEELPSGVQRFTPLLDGVMTSTMDSQKERAHAASHTRYLEESSMQRRGTVLTSSPFHCTVTGSSPGSAAARSVHWSQPDVEDDNHRENFGDAALLGRASAASMKADMMLSAVGGARLPTPLVPPLTSTLGVFLAAAPSPELRATAGQRPVSAMAGESTAGTARQSSSSLDSQRFRYDSSGGNGGALPNPLTLDQLTLLDGDSPLGMAGPGGERGKGEAAQRTAAWEGGSSSAVVADGVSLKPLISALELKQAGGSTNKICAMPAAVTAAAPSLLDAFKVSVVDVRTLSAAADAVDYAVAISPPLPLAIASHPDSTVAITATEATETVGNTTAAAPPLHPSARLIAPAVGDAPTSSLSSPSLTSTSVSQGTHPWVNTVDNPSSFRNSSGHKNDTPSPSTVVRVSSTGTRGGHVLTSGGVAEDVSTAGYTGSNSFSDASAESKPAVTTPPNTGSCDPLADDRADRA
jgi:hypothetical protein